jgi:hypothetical protein
MLRLYAKRFHISIYDTIALLIIVFAISLYMFAQGSDDDKAFAKNMQQLGQRYQQFVFEGYSIYQPADDSS